MPVYSLGQALRRRNRGGTRGAALTWTGAVPDHRQPQIAMNASIRLIAAVLVVPACMSAQDEPSSDVVGTAPVPESPVRRVEQVDISRAFTARDLIGKTVVNYDGERLGTINDVGLSGKWAEQFGTIPVDTSERQAQQPAASAQGGQVVFISTGGLLGLGGRIGMGANWVSVPAENLLYDRAQDRFILNMPQARFEGIAQGRPRVQQPDDAAAGSITTGGRPVIGQETAATAAAEADADVRRIEEAFRQNDSLREQARIQVARTGDRIELTGQVDDEALLRRAEDVARNHTELEVRNRLEVSSAAAE